MCVSGDEGFDFCFCGFFNQLINMKRIFGFIVLIVVLLGVPPHTMTCSADHNRYYKSMSSGIPPIPYATWSASYIASTSNSLDATDLIYTMNAGGGSRTIIATVGKTSGKYYWEFYLNTYTSGDQISVGLASATHTCVTGMGYDAYSWSVGVVFSSPYKVNNTSFTSYGTLFAAGDVISVAPDYGSGSFNVYRNGTIVGSSPAWSGLSGTLYPAMGNSSSTTNGYVATANFGQHAWDSRTATLRATLAGSGYVMGLY